MRQPSHRKRSKRLLKLLKGLQKDDYPITPPTLLATKHLLQNHHRCKFVNIKIDSAAANSPFESPRACLPNFIVSQLEEQKLTDKNSDRVFLSPIVVFILLSLATLSGSESGYPSLFRWYCASLRRTFYLFAYIKHNMPRRTYTYTVEELLTLRGKPTSSGISEDAAEIMWRPGSDSSGRKPAATRHKDDSSATSDEVLFKGTMGRRLGRQLVREISRDPVRALARESVREPTKDAAKGPAKEPAGGARDLAHKSRPMEWKYRGRSGSETAFAEPIPAPSGTPAQQSEGFQRFYKAVVSPTHARMTAGGCIVPNTRGRSSPTNRRISDNPTVQGPNIAEKAVPEQPPLNPVDITQQIPTVSQFVPGYPPGFQSIQTPVSFVPMVFGTPLAAGFPFAQRAVASPVITPLGPDNNLRESHNARSTDPQHDDHLTNDRQEEVKIPQPELLDCAKPYFYNGQIIYPVGTLSSSLGSPIVPVQMVGIPHGVASQLSGHFMQQQPNRAGSMATTASYATPSHGAAGILPIINSAAVPANANFNTSTHPPISSIKRSDITKKQIAAFKGNLKYHEDQLQYNRHQIDEKEMGMKIQTLKDHIKRFEATLKAQLEFEETLQRRNDQDKENKDTPQSTPAVEGNRILTQPAPHGEFDEPDRRRIALGRQGINTNIGEGGKAVFRGPAEPLCDFAQKPGLPTDAALAPVFQPRGYSSTWGGNKYARELAAQDEADMRCLAGTASKLTHLGASELRSMSQSFIAPYQLAPPRTECNLDNVSNTGYSVNGNNASARSDSVQPNLGVPYLLGTLPKDVNPRTARDQDYVYNRPLTEEERRARFLYWGKAPKSAVQGLPKFDGKHFYPPSPAKASPTGSEENAAGPLSSSRLSINHSYRRIETDCDPFRPMTPVERVDSKGLTASEDNCTIFARTLSFETQVNRGSEFQMESGAALRVHEDSTNASSIGSLKRPSEKPGYGSPACKHVGVTKLWQAVLKKGPTGSTVSSTTAQSFLPHYGGHTAASLNPSFNRNQVSSSRDVAPSKFLSNTDDLSEDGMLAMPASEKRPPNGMNSFMNQLEGLSLRSPGRSHLSLAFNM
ncbi:hypothetical protein MMYC01_202016 [Madurella mycetomatis]|uniref:Uncharacterized protein n=1 Tax=Madurella mycetomatis TaxID=100816 RepID=A0A175WDS9_9PEZI|nr:hypothetical protein MMYC01_202016 [Madurella mycetomatis]